MSFEIDLEEKNPELHLEAQLEQSLSLQDWLNRESQLHMTEDQSHMTEDQSHMNEVRLEQSPGTTEKIYQEEKVIKQRFDESKA